MNLEVFGAVPTGLVEDKDGVGTGGDPCGDLVEMKLHGFGETATPRATS